MNASEPKTRSLIAERVDRFVQHSINIECWLLNDEGFIESVGGTRLAGGASQADHRSFGGDAAVGQHVTEVFPALCGLPLDCASTIEFVHTGVDGCVDLHYFPHEAPASLIVRDVTREAQSIRTAQALGNGEALSGEVLTQRLASARAQLQRLALVADATDEDSG